MPAYWCAVCVMKLTVHHLEKASNVDGTHSVDRVEGGGRMNRRSRFCVLKLMAVEVLSKRVLIRRLLTLKLGYTLLSHKIILYMRGQLYEKWMWVRAGQVNDWQHFVRVSLIRYTKTCSLRRCLQYFSTVSLRVFFLWKHIAINFKKWKKKSSVILN